VTLIAAIASVLVAVATLGVVLATFRSARATEGLLATQLTPRLIDVESVSTGPDDPDRPVGLGGQLVQPAPKVGEVVVTTSRDNAVGFCSVPVRNVGAGLARIRSAQVQVRLRGAIAPRVSTTIESWMASKRFLPGGESTRINFLIQEEEVAGALPYTFKLGGGVTLLVHYSAEGSRHEMIATFALSYRDGQWRVGQVFQSDLPESPVA
jgi:hypothetical protein